ncbi:amino acid adenylation domain-containing protein [Streptomyces sp. NPDC052107]|uniref:amino acid adenylation domain-containing protein n=1 Tax=Streptomyces sp. NPDC052107 TaxID=3155632 RepID=UPI003424D551
MTDVLTNGDGGVSLVKEFKDMARRVPDGLALSDGRRTLTYAELDRLSDRIASAAGSKGAKPGGFVGVLVDRTVSTPAAILGVLKTGAAYVPLDPAYPVERLRYIVEDSGVQLLVGTTADARSGGLHGLQLVDVENDDAGDDSWTGAADTADSSDPAYVIYTSGSTGLPKGCVVSHGNVLALLGNTLPLFDFTPSDRWTIFHSHSFDFSVWELWGPLLTGGTGVCVPADVARSPEDFIEFLDGEKITVLNQVPSMFRALVRARQDSPDSARSLRYVIFGGERVDLVAVQDFLAQNDRVRPVVVNMYGITEITVHATFKVLDEEDLRGPCASPIGRELPHLRIDIRDAEGNPSADGEPGEMWVTGPSVALGYLNRPELTRERFHEAAAEGGVERAYRTGDLARRLPDGQLEYLGRNDEQVKLRGFRLELTEVDAALRTHTSVQDAATAVVTRASSGEVLVAFVVPEPGVDRDGLVASLRRHVAAKLPAYMTPARYRLVEALPLTQSGKLDRKALSGAQ